MGANAAGGQSAHSLSGAQILARLLALGAVGAAFTDSAFAVVGSGDATKIARFEVDGLTTATTRVYTLPDANVVVSGSATALTSGRVPFATTGGLLTDSASLTWSGTAFAVVGIATVTSTSATTFTVSSNQTTVTTKLVSTATAGASNLVDIEFYLNNASAAAVNYANILAVSSTTSAGSETCTFTIQVFNAGALNNVLQFVGRNGTLNGITTVANSTDSSSISTGGLVVTGGVGITKTLYVGTGINNTGDLTSIKTGSGNGNGDVIAGTSTAGGNAGYRFQTASTDRWSITMLGSAGAEAMRFRNIGAATNPLQLTYAGSVILGHPAALSTSATDGFPMMPSCAGVPTGVPTAATGKVAFVYDSTNNQIYIYNGAWKKTVALT